ncbi:40S ribosomal protein S25 [Paenibacillus jilunlii]|uniref:40S ribosomal protein S25 n=1 Tax=Paenibacillus jilunlii TaxID=682956 RepID=UPI001FCC5C27|nr:40S ribosomal protein S25 [Paenibacillus jilunlii]
MDFVWKPGQVKFAFEVKGYGPHVQNMDRTRYRQELNRETFLQIAGYRVVSIPYDDLDGSPQLTISLIRSLVAPFISGINVVGQFTRLEREMIRLAVSRDGMIRPVDLGKELGINLRTVRNTLQALCAKGRLRPVSTKSGSRVYRYEVIYSFSDDQLW